MRAVLLFLMALLTAGCASGPMILPESREPRLTTDDAVAVALSDQDKLRVDRYVMAFGEYRYGVETGPIWAKAFVGAPGDSTFKVVSAELRETIAAGGFALRYTYTVVGELSYDGTTVPITATGTRAAAMATMSAMRQAVELGIVDAAAKAKAALSKP